MELPQEVERVLNDKVRPLLAAHGGAVRLADCADGTVFLELLGSCAGCPSADLSTRAMIEDTLRNAIPDVKKVELVHLVDPELLTMTRRLLGVDQNKEN